MATSGTYTFNLDVDTIIQEAMEMLGGEVTSGNELRSAKRSINLILTDWVNRSIPLWVVDTTTVSVAANTTTVTLTSATVDVLEAVWQVSTNSELQMERISNEEYLTYTNKSISGRPNQYSVRRFRDAPVLSLYPVPDNSTGAVKLEQIKKIQDVNNIAIENIDCPTRFLPALTKGVAYEMSLKRPNIPAERTLMLKQLYEETLKYAEEEDRERTSFFVRPRLRR